jgi:phosphosulfolactate synthase
LIANEISNSRKAVGGPATKFVYFIIKFHHPVDQTELIRLSGLPRRTVQGVIEDLKLQSLITESAGIEDARKKVYDLAFDNL